GSHPLDSLTGQLLPSQESAAQNLSRQVRRRSQAGLSEWPAPLPRSPEASGSTQDLRRVPPATLSTRLVGLFETPLRWPRIRRALSGPLHSSRAYLQPPAGLVRRWPSHVPLARFHSPPTEVADPIPR